MLIRVKYSNGNEIFAPCHGYKLKHALMQIDIKTPRCTRTIDFKDEKKSVVCVDIIDAGRVIFAVTTSGLDDDLKLVVKDLLK